MDCAVILTAKTPMILKKEVIGLTKMDVRIQHPLFPRTHVQSIPTGKTGLRKVRSWECHIYSIRLNPTPPTPYPLFRALNQIKISPELFPLRAIKWTETSHDLEITSLFPTFLVNLLRKLDHLLISARKSFIPAKHSLIFFGRFDLKISVI